MELTVRWRQPRYGIGRSSEDVPWNVRFTWHLPADDIARESPYVRRRRLARSRPPWLRIRP